MKIRNALLWAAGPVVLVACATTSTPKLLEDARTAYNAAANGPAADLDPAQLHVAREDLESAEKSFSREGDTFRTRDLAYSALRQAQIADAQARAVEYTEKVNLAEHTIQVTQANQVVAATQALGATQQQLQADRQTLAQEKAAREAAEKRAAQAMADLARVASVREDTRGTVITLSGGVLFASAKSDLLPAAMVNLAQVADALAKSDPDSKILVQGYTDSQGGHAYNLELSKHRAEAVRTFLVAHGVAADRITADGLGMSNPVADNASPEGRADNRRVEIVVQHGVSSLGR